MAISTADSTTPIGSVSAFRQGVTPDMTTLKNGNVVAVWVESLQFPAGDFTDLDGAVFARILKPDGTPVTAPNEQVANATRAVLGGQSVTDAYKAQGVDIPPPGAPVTAPVDPSHLQPGDIARFESRPPVMALGNGKIWMDGQVQPLSALGSSGDFLGWSKPAAPTAVSAHAVTPLAPAMPPAPGGPSPLIPPGSPRPS